MARLVTASLTLIALFAGSLFAQWDPGNGDWSKQVGTDLRIMTWNVQDGICSTNAKQEQFSNWAALTRIVASMQPDVLILQETADNNGNGTGTTVDTVAQLESAVDLFLHGGTDVFNGNVPVTSFVQKYAPGYDLPAVYASTSSDGFNRNLILSRYPFGDLNGDGVDTLADFLELTDLYAPGVNGGIRGYTHVEIDLPDATYAGDLVMGNNHLKAGGSSSDHNQRVTAAKNIAYYIDALFNGLGTGTADPNGKILNPAAIQLVSADTVVITGGDWNEDEIKNGGTKGPADWISKAQNTGGTDGTDRDRSDMTYDAATDLFNGNSSTQSSSKLDYICWQDSIATLRRAWIFNSSTVPSGATPPELVGFAINPQLASGVASDHRPVIADFILPLAAGCSDPTTDLGNGKAGTGGLVPKLSACGGLGSGDTADFMLVDALPSASAYLIASLNSIFAPFSGGVLVPAPDVILGPFATDAGGALTIAAVPGGGGPFDLFIQYVILDPGASFGRSFSNGLAVHFLP